MGAFEASFGSSGNSGPVLNALKINNKIADYGGIAPLDVLAQQRWEN